MINGTPEIMCLSFDRHEDFIKMPFPERKAGPFVQKQIVYHDSEPMRSSQRIKFDYIYLRMNNFGIN